MRDRMRPSSIHRSPGRSKSHAVRDRWPMDRMPSAESSPFARAHLNTARPCTCGWRARSERRCRSSAANWNSRKGMAPEVCCSACACGSSAIMRRPQASCRTRAGAIAVSARDGSTRPARVYGPLDGKAISAERSDVRAATATSSSRLHRSRTRIV